MLLAIMALLLTMMLKLSTHICAASVQHQWHERTLHWLVASLSHDSSVQLC
jgi:hypothetical protein